MSSFIIPHVNVFFKQFMNNFSSNKLLVEESDDNDWCIYHVRNAQFDVVFVLSFVTLYISILSQYYHKSMERQLN